MTRRELSIALAAWLLIGSYCAEAAGKNQSCQCDDEKAQIKNIQNQLDLINTQFAGCKEELEDKWKRFQQYQSNEVEAYHEAYKAAVALCALGDIVWTLASDKLTDAFFDLKSIKKLGEGISEGIGLATSIVDKLEEARTVIETCRDASEGMRDKVIDCFGKIPDDVYRGALNYTSNLEIALDKMTEVRLVANRCAGKLREGEDLVLKINILEAQCESLMKDCKANAQTNCGGPRIGWGKWRATYSSVEDARSNCPGCGRGGDTRWHQTENGTVEFVAFGDLIGAAERPIVLSPEHERKMGKLVAIRDVKYKDGTHAHEEQTSNYGPRLPLLSMCSGGPDPIQWEHEQTDPSGDNFLRQKYTWTFEYLGAYEPEPIRLVSAVMPLGRYDCPIPRLRNPSNPSTFLPERDSVEDAVRAYVKRLTALWTRSRYQYSAEFNAVYQIPIARNPALRDAWETVRPAFERAMEAWGRPCFMGKSDKNAPQPLVRGDLTLVPECSETDAEHSAREADLKRDVQSYHEILTQLTNALADATSALAQRMKSRDREVSDDLQALAQRLRQEGLVAFGESRFRGNSPKAGWGGGRN